MDRASFRKELSRERSARGSSGSVLVAYFAVYFFMLAEPDRHCMQAFLLGAGLCPVAARGPLVAVRSLVAEYGLLGMQTSEAVGMGSVVASPGLQSRGSGVVATGLVAPRHVGSSQARD